MTFEVSVIAGVAKRTLVSLTDTAISPRHRPEACATRPPSCAARSRRACPPPRRAGARRSGPGGGRRSPRSAARPAFALGDMHVDAVQVIARLLGRDRELRLVEQPPQHRGGAESSAYSDEAITGKSSRGRWRAEGRPPGLITSAARRGVVGQVTSAPSGSLRTISCSITAETVVAPGALDHGGGAVDHLDIQIGGAELTCRPRPRSARWPGSGWCCAARRPTGPAPRP
jgi:hypothetical protein